jgi:hypothetical protein
MFSRYESIDSTVDYDDKRNRSLFLFRHLIICSRLVSFLIPICVRLIMILSFQFYLCTIQKYVEDFITH